MTPDAAANGEQSLLVNIPKNTKNSVGEKRTLKETGYGAASATLDADGYDEHRLFLQDGAHIPSLDVARIVCVGLVAVNHGGSKWSDRFGVWNQMYVQQWVLQWLFVVCGMSFAMSSRNTSGYLGRLMVYFLLGVSINWCAWVMKGLDWKKQPWDMVFQFWFIFGLMGYIAFLTPLKHHLKAISAPGARLAQDRDFGLTTGVAIILGLLVIINITFQFALGTIFNYFLGSVIVGLQKTSGNGGTFWGLPGNLQESESFFKELLSYIQISVGSYVILWIFPKISNQRALTTWLVLAYVFSFRCLSYRGEFARIVDGFDFTMIGLASCCLGLSYRRTIGKYMVRYWFVVLFVFACLIPPGTWGRWDELTIGDLSFRIRWHLVELGMTILFLCSIERMADTAIFSEDKLQWLSWWALYVFLVHKALHIILPQPFNWLALLALAPISWVLHGKSGASSSTQDKQPSVPSKSPPQQASVEKSLEDGVLPTDEAKLKEGETQSGVIA